MSTKIEIATYFITTILMNSKDKIVTDDDYKKFTARIIGNIIFDLPHNLSGLISSKLIQQDGHRPSMRDCTKEHFYSRQESGVEIINKFTISTDIIAFTKCLAHDLEFKYTMVHLVTKKENRELCVVQNDENTKALDWSKQYDLAGIDLVADPGCANPNTALKVSIRGIIFISSQVASEHFGCTRGNVNKWCSAGNKWSRDDCFYL